MWAGTPRRGLRILIREIREIREIRGHFPSPVGIEIETGGWAVFAGVSG
jgi:hypothetical protein